MKNLKKKGFTLIELMIVLAIIAILAIVLVPKAAQMKDSARNAGVTTNVNAVRGTLEAKVVDTNYLGNPGNTGTLLQNTFLSTGANALANPFNANAKTVLTGNYPISTSISAGYSIEVYDTGIANVPTTPTGTAVASSKGIVYVYVYGDGYLVFGIDSTLNVVNVAVIK